jgi:hypothetical protein
MSHHTDQRGGIVRGGVANRGTSPDSPPKVRHNPDPSTFKIKSKGKKVSEVSVSLAKGHETTRFWALVRSSDPCPYKHIERDTEPDTLETVRRLSDLARLRKNGMPIPDFVVESVIEEADAAVKHYLQCVALLGTDVLDDTMITGLITDAANTMCQKAALFQSLPHSFATTEKTAEWQTLADAVASRLPPEQRERITVLSSTHSLLSGFIPGYQARNVRRRGYAKVITGNLPYYRNYWYVPKAVPEPGDGDNAQTWRDPSHTVPEILESAGDPIDEPMYQIWLPTPKRVLVQTRERNTHYSMMGPRLKVSRAISGKVYKKPMPRPFKRSIHSPGGTILLDASGSMHFSNSELQEFLSRAPAANVSYYSTHCDYGLEELRKSDHRIRITDKLTRRQYGYLLHYARDGQMYDRPDIPIIGGGNGVDLQALQWLLTMPAPRYFVTDLGFCGGPDDNDQKAHRLMHAACSSGLVQHYETLPGLLAAI